MKCLVISVAVIFLLVQIFRSSTGHQMRKTFKSPLDPGSCSRNCNSTEADENKKFPCSCSRGCSAYKDCCYDSEWRDEAEGDAELICVPISGVGAVSLVGGCPTSWTASSEFCTDGFGTLLPVTSRDTGISYANHFCAICNSDADNIVTWDVDFKCCSDHSRLPAYNPSTMFEYDMQNNLLWSILDREGTKVHCQCKYFVRGNPNHLASQFELRTCQRSEISTCSRAWRNTKVRELCSAYLDPIYIYEKVYRNVHCAVCNFVNVEESACKPKIVDVLQKLGLPVADLKKYCEQHGLETCLHFINRSRGKASSFSRMFAIHQNGCIPPYGKMCCDGELYDSKHKRCRKLRGK